MLYIGRGLAAIRPTKGTDTGFLLHYLRFIEPKLSSAGRGSTFSAITMRELRELEIPLPPLPEQRHIAAVLDQADTLRQKRRAALAKLDTLLHLFGDPVTNPGRLPVVALQVVCTRVTDGTHQPPKWVESGVPFLFVSNVVNGKLNFETKKFISLKTFYELNRRCPVEIGDILYTIVGSYGNAAMVETEHPFPF
jgi:type I restriction enzyme S subunit